MIAIKSMENIPRSCIECPLRMLDKCYHLKSACELNEFDIFEERPKGCPLVEIVTCKDCKYNYENSCDFEAWMYETEDVDSDGEN